MIIKRKLRPVSGELGQVDVAVMYEYLRERNFLYDCYTDETCLICIDEEPPKQIDKEALDIALQIAKLLKADIPDEIHIMRKIVIDGSNVCSFQRTAIIGMNGTLETSLGNVGISNINLEEESAGIVREDENEMIYRLDRLGIPLIEIGTAPDIKNPEHAKEVAKKLGMIVRSTGKSQRGLGVTRQDVNVSVKGGARVEIKGVQDLDTLSIVIDNEINRQLGLIEKGEKPKEETRVAKKDGTTEYTRPLPGGERLYPETDLAPIVLDKKYLFKIKIPETWEEKAKKFSKILPEEMIEQVIKGEYLEMFEDFHKKYDPVMVANTFTSIIKDLRRNDVNIDFSKEQFDGLFSAVKKKKISKEAIPEILEIISKEKISLEEAIQKSGLKSMDERELKEIVRKVLEKHPDLVEAKRFSPLMGLVMKYATGRIDGSIVSKVLKEEMEK
jgi:Glu-tRNA(Gln) amidotransferase subunit E-like FAD-binding protein